MNHSPNRTHGQVCSDADDALLRPTEGANRFIRLHRTVQNPWAPLVDEAVRGDETLDRLDAIRRESDRRDQQLRMIRAKLIRLSGPVGIVVVLATAAYFALQMLRVFA